MFVPSISIGARLLLVLICIALTGCASTHILYEGERTPAAHRAIGSKLASHDPDVQRQRFGTLAETAGKYFVGRLESGSVYAERFRWSIPGVALDQEANVPFWQHWRFQYDPEARIVRVFNMLASGGPRYIRDMTVDAAGVATVHSSLGGLAPEYKLNYQQQSGLQHGTVALKEVDADTFAQIEQDAADRRREEKRRSSAENQQLLEGITRGISAASQAYSESRPTTRPQVSPRPISAPAPTRSSSNDVPLPRPVARAPSQPTPAQVASVPRQEAREVTPRSGSSYRPQVSARSGSAQNDTSAAARSNRQATPEAIVVCTKPNAAGAFECDTPVDTNLRGGPKNGLSSWNTPESMIGALSASCPGARRLPSTTHLVWGCGFGATNNSNSMDRSAGVDVRGRNTYYCSEKQTSCRSTQP